MERGRSSGVEHNLAKVGVEGSNPFARSNYFIHLLETSLLTRTPRGWTGKHRVSWESFSRMDFIGEDDLLNFDGFLKYQGVDPAAITPEDLKMWRGCFDEA